MGSFTQNVRITIKEAVVVNGKSVTVWRREGVSFTRWKENIALIKGIARIAVKESIIAEDTERSGYDPHLRIINKIGRSDIS